MPSRRVAQGKIHSRIHRSATHSRSSQLRIAQRQQRRYITYAKLARTVDKVRHCPLPWRDKSQILFFVATKALAACGQDIYFLAFLMKLLFPNDVGPLTFSCRKSFNLIPVNWPNRQSFCGIDTWVTWVILGLSGFKAKFCPLVYHFVCFKNWCGGVAHFQAHPLDCIDFEGSGYYGHESGFQLC